ncbi:MAG: type II toxin-antitoxin system HicA family toxin [Nitrososphaerota archaeon]|nr:type II toxin-antitoxin system HicA family toxin [Nitrososphaerota archaeon]
MKLPSDKLPAISGKELIKILSKLGFTPARQKGSHVFLRHPDGRRTVVPLHQEINKSTLVDILSQTKLSREEFLKLL